MAPETLLWLIPLPPLVAFALIILFTNRSKGLSHTVAVGAALLSWLASMIVLVQAVGKEDLASNPVSSSIPWLPTGASWFNIGVQLDPLQVMTLFFVAWTVLAIFVYSIGYHNYGQPKGDHDVKGLPPHGATVKDHGKTHTVPSVEPMYSRFFAFISLFAFAMFTLVVSDNLLTLYIGWEIMGLCSYLLIGFWYGKESAARAAMKAFLTTRVGDVFMLLGLALLYSFNGSLSYRDIFAPEAVERMAAASTGVLGLSVAGLAGLLLFIGTVGKSAQWPLHVWLPDAMEGPTPVSAMIHAATMVSAGVYLAIRIFPLTTAGWEPGAAPTTVMSIMAVIGTFTALFAATIALAQNDIKRVLAYSTISQLGFMIAALGVGAYVAAAFHLMTHAFFKALLFLGSGSVIHGMEHGVLHTGKHIDPQDMFNMGGLRHKMPVTFWTFLIGGFALAGFPLVTAGFWSKDEILTGAFNGNTTLSMIVFVTLALTALLTAFYTMRQITLTFLGEPRTKAAEHAQETPATMTGPLAVLAVFAVAAGWVGIPAAFPGLGGLVPNWLEELLAPMIPGAAHGAEGAAEVVAHSPIPLLTSLVVALGGLYLGWMVYRRVTSARDPLQQPLGFYYNWIKNKYYFDEFYGKVFIRPARWLAEVFTSDWMDHRTIDGILHGIAKGALAIGNLARDWFDVKIIKNAGDNTGKAVTVVGFSLKAIQTGRVQQYMISGLLAAMVIIAAFILLMVNGVL